MQTLNVHLSKISYVTVTKWGMDMYDFDKIIDRRKTSCLKYDFQMERRGRDDLLPLWVADMDFALPENILDDIKKRVSHGIFGYTDPKGDYFDSVIGWFESHFGWRGRKEWITVTPGVVVAISVAVRALTQEGDGVLIQQPVYYPFSEAVILNKRKLVNNQLVYKDGEYSIDFEDFEKKIVDEDVKLFILCSPHNPVGRVWTQEELRKMGEICLKHNVIIVSDEIHCDFTYAGYKHTMFPSLGREFENNVVLCTAPSKTFNIAGLHVSNIFIPNPEIRKKFKDELEAFGFSQPNVMGLVACQSVYSKGNEWYQELKKYIADNLSFVRTFLAEKMPKIKLVEPQGTYLIWLDCVGLGLSVDELEHFVEDKAKLWVDFGKIFGKESGQFIRLNIACQKATLRQALEQLEKAYN